MRYNKNADSNMFENFDSKTNDFSPPIITTMSDDNKHIYNIPLLIKQMSFLPYRKYNLECIDFNEQFILHTCNRRRHPVALLPITNNNNQQSKSLKLKNNHKDKDNKNSKKDNNKNNNKMNLPKVGSYGILALPRYQNRFPKNLYTRPTSYTIDTSKRIKITKVNKNKNDNNNIIYCDGDVIEDHPLSKEDESEMEYLIKELLLLGIVFEYPLVDLPKSYEGKSFSFVNMLNIGSGNSFSNNSSNNKSLLKNVISTQNTLERMKMVYNTLNRGIFPERFNY